MPECRHINLGQGRALVTHPAMMCPCQGKLKNTIDIVRQARTQSSKPGNANDYICSIHIYNKEIRSEGISLNSERNTMNNTQTL